MSSSEMIALVQGTSGTFNVEYAMNAQVCGFVMDASRSCIATGNVR